MKYALLIFFVFFVKLSIANFFYLSYDKDGVKVVKEVYHNIGTTVFLNTLKKYKINNCTISSPYLNIYQIGKSNRFVIEQKDTINNTNPVIIYFSFNKKKIDSIFLNQSYYKFSFFVTNERDLSGKIPFIKGLVFYPTEWNDTFVVKNFSIVIYDTSLNKKDSFFINGNKLDSFQKVTINGVINNFSYLVFKNIIIECKGKKIIIPTYPFIYPFFSIYDDEMHKLHLHFIEKYLRNTSFRYLYKLI